ncbi:hypothetical protein WOLCODRAFT_121539 [Wolfiporia cocos MD-104 SS10]|uniref:Nudix hydrolase domain-containing protein n=1 Tax=Wolfiporia cocos (strain MD-104) TaxID=742152 RepID=A0A2H3JML7_WOLCO|nr:hypothetical protein WOLCODRAFT_121539 [Wolfiporia cocos MD-104 SS10]
MSIDRQAMNRIMSIMRRGRTPQLTDHHPESHSTQQTPSEHSSTNAPEYRQASRPSRRSSTPAAPYGHRFSEFSSPAVPASIWYSSDFLLGAGMVILQPSSGKVLLCCEGERWFLPKGRKDVGESLEQAALREAYEESGYRVEFLPVVQEMNAPRPPGSRRQGNSLTTEPFYVSATAYGPGCMRSNGIEYIIFWYIGQIAADAVRETGTGMPDEQHYEAHLLDFDAALNALNNSGSQESVLLLRMAHCIWLQTKKVINGGSPPNNRVGGSVLEAERRDDIIT